ncbi:hypothetical protein SPFL3102_01495 [Sporomusaceae bacterium FL31]|nr:hypothetical protein SPFL3101_03128 [Sporomusaceae bacterium FL31]GCE33687.1 hypothetical protein SPFL3102_01495 [Sporomusaceae bacterium]
MSAIETNQQVEGQYTDEQIQPVYKVSSEFKIKEMTGSTMRALRNAGLDPALPSKANVELGDNEKNAAMIDWVMENVYPEYGEIPYWKQVKLAWATYNLAYGGPEAVKNL